MDPLDSARGREIKPMKASEFIDWLKVHIATHGNLDLRISTNGQLCPVGAGEVFDRITVVMDKGTRYLVIE